MKRGLCLLCMLAMLVSMVGCGRQETVVQAESPLARDLSEEEKQALDKLFSDWLTLLTWEEKRLSQENYALQHILNIQDSATWENYVYARTACGFTRDMVRYLSQTAIEPTMTDEDYQILADMGMDLQDIQMEIRIYNIQTLPSLQKVDVPLWSEYYLMNLMYLGYDESTMALLTASAENRCQMNINSMKYWYLINNYILLELPEAYAQRLEEEARANAPLIMQQYAQGFSSATEVLNEMNQVMNDMEGNLLRHTEILTATEALLEKNTVAPKTVENLPQILPFPEIINVDFWEIQYYWKDGDEIRTPEYRMEMDTIPNCMVMSLDNVTLDDCQRYVLYLAEMGWKPDEMTDSAALYNLQDGGLMLISYEEGTIQISVREGQVCFAPLWYMDALEQGK